LHFGGVFGQGKEPRVPGRLVELFQDFPGHGLFLTDDLFHVLECAE
jgi:hypothetical protein